jgi:uncharacterized protein YndB with AHSA1/START domain
MTEPAHASVTVSQRYEAAPERVFDAFLDVSIARCFLFATATGEMIVAQIDPCVGGRYRFIERRPDMGDVEHAGEYLKIDRPRRLVFSFGVPTFDPGLTTVAVDILSDDEGCVLTLTNDGVPAEYVEGNRQGWTGILAGLLPAYEGIHAAGWR